MVYTVLNDKQREDLIKKVRSGNYYLWLGEFNRFKGQHMTLFPSNKGIKSGLKPRKEIIKVRPPNPKSVSKSKFTSGAAYKSGRFTVFDNGIRKILFEKK